MQKAVCRTVPAVRLQNIGAIEPLQEQAGTYETIAAQIRDYKSSNKTPFNAKQENRAQAGELANDINNDIANTAITQSYETLKQLPTEHKSNN